MRVPGDPTDQPTANQRGTGLLDREHQGSCPVLQRRCSLALEKSMSIPTRLFTNFEEDATQIRYHHQTNQKPRQVYFRLLLALKLFSEDFGVKACFRVYTLLLC